MTHAEKLAEEYGQAHDPNCKALACVLYQERRAAFFAGYRAALEEAARVADRVHHPRQTARVLVGGEAVSRTLMDEVYQLQSQLAEKDEKLRQLGIRRNNENSDLLVENLELRHERDRYRAALELIAAPRRADGTYNRSRETCEALAREALGGRG